MHDLLTDVAHPDLASPTPCDIGRVWDLTRGGNDDECSKPAEWSALAHDCHMGQAILLCTEHLVSIRKDRRPQEFIKYQCKECRQIMVSVDELIWHVARL